MDLTSIGKRVRDARIARGYTQEYLAEQVDLSATHISVLERGLKVPRLDTFVKIANTLNVSADMLLFDVLEHTPPEPSEELLGLLRSLAPKEQQRMLKLLRVLTEDD